MELQKWEFTQMKKIKLGIIGIGNMGSNYATRVTNGWCKKKYNIIYAVQKTIGKMPLE